MYLNVQAAEEEYDGRVIEPQHRMYLNTYIYLSSTSILAIEPQHRMYLNNINIRV